MMPDFSCICDGFQFYCLAQDVQDYKHSKKSKKVKENAGYGVAVVRDSAF